MSTHLIGIKPPDDKWKKMKAAYDACADAGVDPPKEVMEFFSGGLPDDDGVIVDLSPKMGTAVEKWNGASCSGLQVELDKLSKDIKILRFYNTW